MHAVAEARGAEEQGEREHRSPVARSHFDPRTSSDEHGGARVLGEVTATKPAWKRRRASENDDELLQLLADGLGQWIATHKEAPEH